ncbi:hypothetical protein [Paraclostridium bifermentans]|uniref:hypothetical protein n=1 Tax=Paraclostridium bifermentans TaxID=1490 RepID=UPI00189DB8F5|nr:hypothetical protein [Paraclostridium bifermentans]
MINVNEYFIKLPNNLIWAYEEGEVSITKAMNNKTILVLSNLMFRCNPLGICYFTLEDLITDLGYKPKTGKGKINEQIKDILVKLEEMGFIKEAKTSMPEIKFGTFVKCKINNNVPKNEDGDDVEFFKMYYRDYIKLINLDTKSDKDILLNSYCYINSRIKHRGKDDRSISEYSWRNEGKAEYTYFTYEEAIKDLGITEATFKENIDILSQYELIAYGNIGLIKKDDKTRMANNVYVVDIEELQPALNDSKYYYKENGYEILGKKSNDDTKKIIGLSSRINQLNEQGYDTSKLDKKLSKLEKQKEKKVKPKEIDIEQLREEVRKLCVDNIHKVGSYAREWNNKYNTTVLECTDADKLLELKKIITNAIKITNEKVIF